MNSDIQRSWHYLAYAVYFDHKRQSNPEFRKALKRESKRTARAAKVEAEAHGARQKEAIRDALNEAKEQGFPTEIEEKEAYFMQEVSRGETLCQDGWLIQSSSGGSRALTHRTRVEEN